MRRRLVVGALTVLSALLGFAVVGANGRGGAVPVSDPGCSFERGVTTCTSSTSAIETEQHIEYSGCLYGPTGIPGRRERTVRFTFEVVTTVTTTNHGRNGASIGSSSATTRTLVAAETISDVCVGPTPPPA